MILIFSKSDKGVCISGPLATRQFFNSVTLLIQNEYCCIKLKFMLAVHTVTILVNAWWILRIKTCQVWTRVVVLKTYNISRTKIGIVITFQINYHDDWRYCQTVLHFSKGCPCSNFRSVYVLHTPTSREAKHSFGKIRDNRHVFTHSRITVSFFSCFIPLTNINFVSYWLSIFPPLHFHFWQWITD